MLPVHEADSDAVHSPFLQMDDEARSIGQVEDRMKQESAAGAEAVEAQAVDSARDAQAGADAEAEAEAEAVDAGDAVAVEMDTIEMEARMGHEESSDAAAARGQAEPAVGIKASGTDEQLSSELPAATGGAGQEDDAAAHATVPASSSFYSLSALDIDGKKFDFSALKGKVVLITNVASKCGYTDQNYKGLQILQEKYGRYGLVILAFPCNQFGNQERGTNAEIKEFAVSQYGATFQMMEKVEVNGENAHPVFQWLKRNTPKEFGGGGGTGPGNDLGWNFQKFIVDKNGYPRAWRHQKYDTTTVQRDVYGLLRET